MGTLVSLLLAINTCRAVGSWFKGASKIQKWFM